MEDQEIVKRLKQCLEDLYEKDEYLFRCDVCERCLMFRLGHYLQLSFHEYFVDCEFNKMGFCGNERNPKVMLSRDGGHLKKMYADIIVHKRNQRIEDNLFCIELKTYKNNQNSIASDISRLTNMTNAEGFYHQGTIYAYGYNLGFFIVLAQEANRRQFRIFRNGTEAINPFII